MTGHEYKKPGTIPFLGKRLVMGKRDNTHKIFCVLTQASCCTPWVLSDWPMFGDEPVYPIWLHHFS